jgi:hypothetical protein
MIFSGCDLGTAADGAGLTKHVDRDVLRQERRFGQELLIE